MSLEFLPGSTLGILGDGVTSRTLAQSAHNMGYNVAAYSTNPDAPVLAEADYRFVEQGNQLTEFESFMALSSMVTYTSSWLPANMITELQSARLPQGTELLELTDDHALGRAFSEAQSFNILPYATVSSLDEVAHAAAELGYPVVVKPIFKHKHHDDTVILRGDWDLGLVAPMIDGGTLIVETWLDDAQEFAMTAVRGVNGEIKTYPLRQTMVAQQQLRRAWTVGDIADDLMTVMLGVTERVGDVLQYIGAYNVAFFYSATGNLYVRDIAAGIQPTATLYDATTNVSVAEQHLRAITGQALTDVLMSQAAVYMPFTADQIDALSRHWSIQSNWKFSFYQNDMMLPQAGHVLACGSSANQLFNQLHVAGVWEFEE